MKELLKSDYQPTVALDFDGVIHSYTSGWQGITVIPDKPVKGVAWAIELLRSNGYKVVLYSTRCAIQKGRQAIKNYLRKWNIKVDEIVVEKPVCICYVDDRAILFNGNWEQTFNDIITFENYIERSKEKKKENKTINQIRKENNLSPLEGDDSIKYSKDLKNE